MLLVSLESQSYTLSECNFLISTAQVTCLCRPIFKTPFFWVVIPPYWVIGSRLFEGTYSIHLQRSTGQRRIHGIIRGISHGKPASAGECNFILQLGLPYCVKCCTFPADLSFLRKKCAKVWNTINRHVYFCI